MAGFKVSRNRRGTRESIHVQFPNGEVHLLERTPAALSTKAVLEVFAPAFLRIPGAVRVARAGTLDELCHVDHSDAIGLRWDDAHKPPRIILADVHPDAPKVVFVEVVPTDGAITAQRKAALSEVATEAGLRRENVFFVTAFADRSASAFRKLVSEIAWGSFAWFTSKPDKLLAFREGQATELQRLFNY